MAILRWFSKGGYQEKTLWTSEDRNWSVVDGEKSGVKCRFLIDGEGRLQSGVVLGDVPIPIFQYARAMVTVACHQQSKNVLVLGGGGFCIPTAICHFVAGAEVDVVDRETRLKEVAEKYFFKPDNERLNFIEGEVKEVLSKGKTSDDYDLVIVDVFEENGLVPSELFDVEIFSSLKNLLGEDGVFLWNISAGRGGRWEEAVGRILSTAGRVGVVMKAFFHEEQSSNFYRNILLSNGAIDLDLLPGWGDAGIAEHGDTISATSPLVWPERHLRKGIGSNWVAVS